MGDLNKIKQIIIIVICGLIILIILISFIVSLYPEKTYPYENE